MSSNLSCLQRTFHKPGLSSCKQILGTKADTVTDRSLHAENYLSIRIKPFKKITGGGKAEFLFNYTNMRSFPGHLVPMDVGPFDHRMIKA